MSTVTFSEDWLATPSEGCVSKVSSSLPLNQQLSCHLSTSLGGSAVPIKLNWMFSWSQLTTRACIYWEQAGLSYMTLREQTGVHSIVVENLRTMHMDLGWLGQHWHKHWGCFAREHCPLTWAQMVIEAGWKADIFACISCLSPFWAEGSEVRHWP